MISISGAPDYATDKSVVLSSGPGTYTVNGQPQLGVSVYLPDQWLSAGSPGLHPELRRRDDPDAGIAQFPDAVGGLLRGSQRVVQPELHAGAKLPGGQTASASSPWNFTLTNYAPNRTQCVNLGGIVCFKTRARTGTRQFTVFVPAADMNKAVDPSWQPGQPAPDGERDLPDCFGAGIDGKTDSTGQRNNGNGVMAGMHRASSSSPSGGRVPVAITAFKHYDIDGTQTTNGFFVGPTSRTSRRSCST